jgi:hypothetical protein
MRHGHTCTPRRKRCRSVRRRIDRKGELMDFNAGNIQTPQEMLERWDCIPCTCDPDVWHLCEICHDTEVVRRLMAQAIIVEGGIDDN